MEEFSNMQEGKVETRSNGSQVYTSPYDKAAIERLKHLIVTFYSQGDRKFYAILVDGETVVPKNCDGRKFDRYLKFINSHTKEIVVKMYQGYSPNCNKHVFIMNQSLSGLGQAVDVQAQINKALEEDRLKRELQDLQIKLDKKTKKYNKLKEERDKEPSNLDKWRDFVKGGVEIAGLLGLTPRAALAGTPETTQDPDAEVTVEIDEEVEGSESQQIYNDLLATFGEDGVKNALGWMTVLSSHPELQEKLKKEIDKLKKQKEDGAA